MLGECSTSQMFSLRNILTHSVWRLAKGWTVRGSNPGGSRFSALVQTDPWTQPASYTMGTRSFSRVKRPGCGVHHPTPSSAEVKGRVEVYLYSTSGSSWPVVGRTLSLPLPLCNIISTKLIQSLSIRAFFWSPVSVFMPFKTISFMDWSIVWCF